MGLSGYHTLPHGTRLIMQSRQYFVVHSSLSIQAKELNLPVSVKNLEYNTQTSTTAPSPSSHCYLEHSVMSLEAGRNMQDGFGPERWSGQLHRVLSIWGVGEGGRSDSKWVKPLVLLPRETSRK